MIRVQVRLPEDLWDRVGEVAPAGNKSFYIRRVLEEALAVSGSDQPTGGIIGGPATAAPAARPASPRASEMTPVRELVDEASTAKEQKLELLREQMQAVTGEEEPAKVPQCDCGEDAVRRPGPGGREFWACPRCEVALGPVK